MKIKLINIVILLTGLSFASDYHYTQKINDINFLEKEVDLTKAINNTGIESSGVVLDSDGGVDWYGEIAESNLIGLNELKTKLSLISGSGTDFSFEVKWLHVGIDGKELFIAKSPLRQMNGNNLISNNLLNGSRTIEINEELYKVRLLSCANSSSPVHTSGFDVAHSHGSEFNRIMYRLTSDESRNANSIKDSEKPFKHLAYYEERELFFHTNISNQTTACMEIALNGSIITRGAFGVSHYIGTNVSNGTGWRPVLEKVN